jgi:hypothetical protein
MFNKLNLHQKLNYNYIYPTIHDAVLYILKCKRLNTSMTSISSKSISLNIEQYNDKTENDMLEPIYTKNDSFDLLNEIIS